MGLLYIHVLSYKIYIALSACRPFFQLFNFERIGDG